MEETIKKHFLILLVLFITNVVFAVKVGDMNELLKPSSLRVDGDDLFVVEDSTFSIHVYSLKTLKMKYKLTGKGEGPREFKVRPNIQEVTPNHILGCAWNKLIWFSREGKMIKEVITSEPNFRLITPLKDNYAGVEINFHRETGELDYVLILLNSQFEKIKELARADKYVRVEFTNQPRETVKTHLLRHLAAYTVYDDKVFMINTQKGFYFDVFDHQGKLLYVIDKNKEVEKMKVDDAFKERLRDYVKLHNRAMYDSYLRKNLLFHTHFPAAKNFWVNDKKIYVITYKEKDGLREMVVLDLKGKILNRIFLPLKSIKLTRIVGGDTFAVSNGVLYELIDNEETEMWELHKTDLSTVKENPMVPGIYLPCEKIQSPSWKSAISLIIFFTSLLGPLNIPNNYFKFHTGDNQSFNWRNSISLMKISVSPRIFFTIVLGPSHGCPVHYGLLTRSYPHTHIFLVSKTGTGILFAVIFQKDGDRYFICRTPNIPVKGGEKRGDSQEVVAKSRLSR